MGMDKGKGEVYSEGVCDKEGDAESVSELKKNDGGTRELNVEELHEYANRSCSQENRDNGNEVKEKTTVSDKLPVEVCTVSPTLPESAENANNTTASVSKSTYANVASKHAMDNKLMFIPTEMCEVASRLGTPLIMDVVTTTVCNRGTGSTGFARVLVEVDAKKGLPSQVEIVYKNSESNVTGSKFVDVEYDWKPPLCSTCKVFGHNNGQCHNKDEKENAEQGKKVDNDGFRNVEIKRNYENVGK
ncbi:zinc knuckle CX2CX4HX4C [Artemisia annua]|uniref:Zinc knuckle CX2CX4HX4C n=1 Tax=Artemisia annua TaxID=35608 RepID=A0A2U1NLF2_ARTAN|nr:zinc knuckle CX2CX4HX4C [Artemisia annua]